MRFHAESALPSLPVSLRTKTTLHPFLVLLINPVPSLTCVPRTAGGTADCEGAGGGLGLALNGSEECRWSCYTVHLFPEPRLPHNTSASSSSSPLAPPLILPGADISSHRPLFRGVASSLQRRIPALSLPLRTLLPFTSQPIQYFSSVPACSYSTWQPELR